MKTVSTLVAVAGQIRGARTIDDAESFLSAFVARVHANASARSDAETRRLRAEVRRLRREKRYVAVAGANLLGLIDAFEGLEGERITDEPEDEAVLYQAREMIDAALARRRRKK